MNDFRRLRNARPRQRGAVLFISLIMLLLMTLIGITAMQVTLLQERMAGGFRVQHQAFEQTEGTLKDTRKSLNDAANTSGPLYYSPDATLTASTNALPWATWLTTEPVVADPSLGISQVNAHISVGSPPAVMGQHVLKYFVVSALNEDPGGSGDAKSAVQAVFIY
jgi:type IV pilus assembly protein PilX